MQKRKRIESKVLRDSAKGEQCTFQIASVCSGDTATTVLCHLPDESHGFGRKSDDISSAFGCASCHDVIDGRVHQFALTAEDRLYYSHRAMKRTWRRWIEMGLLTIKGLK